MASNKQTIANEEEILNPFNISPERRAKIEAEEKERDKQFTTELLKYRSEQLTVIKVNGIINNHAETKVEIHAKRYVTQSNYCVDLLLTDSIITVYPDQLQEALNLMCELDFIKHNVSVVIDKLTGRIKNILNMDYVQEAWIQYKQKFYEKYAFVKTPDVKTKLDAFINNAEAQMTEKDILLDFETRPFFDLFFDRYLVNSYIDTTPYSKQYCSQLFNNKPVQMNGTKKVIHETPVAITIVKEVKLDKKNTSMVEFENLYNQQYKPTVGYKFSDYNFEHKTEIILNPVERIVETASMNINENIQNNIELFIDYKLRRIQ